MPELRDVLHGLRAANVHHSEDLRPENQTLHEWPYAGTAEGGCHGAGQEQGNRSRAWQPCEHQSALPAAIGVQHLPDAARSPFAGSHRSDQSGQPNSRHSTPWPQSSTGANHYPYKALQGLLRPQGLIRGDSRSLAS